MEQLLRLDSSSSQFNDQVSKILHGKEYKQWANHIDGTDMTRLIDFLDRALNTLDPTSSGFRTCLRELRHTCGARRSYGDVYEGILNGSMVRVKRVKVYPKGGPGEATKTFCKEAIIWKHLEHGNIVPLIGVTTTPLQLISGWMPGGDLTDYIGKHPAANRLGLVCDIAEGLSYLHSRDIVHGHIKGSNVLVDDTGHARITDFGLVMIAQDLDLVRALSDGRDHTGRWIAPEILSGGSHSKEGDVFSFAMVMIEVFTGAIPSNHGPPAAVILAITRGTRPPRPTHPQFTNGLWELMQSCWSWAPHLRPEVSEISEALRCTGNPIRTELPENAPRAQPLQCGQSGRILKRSHPPGTNGHPTRHHSRRYFILHVLESVSNLLLWAQERELSAGTKRTLKILSDPDPPPTKPNPLEQLLRLDSSSTNFSDQVSNFLHGVEYKQWAKRINGADAVELVSFLEGALDTLDPTSPSFRRCLRQLRRVSSASMTLPTSYTLSAQVLTVGHQPVVSGSSGDVYEGTLSGSKVCVKRIRVNSKDGPEKATKMLYQEAIIWKRLDHKNIVSFLGTTATPLQIISGWMSGGNLVDYIGKHPEANRLGLICDVAEGLCYLSSRKIVHSNLKGSNVLVDETGRARITDFALAIVIRKQHSIRTPLNKRGHTARWTAPEILNETGSYSKEADVFSFAMVVIEVFTGAVPFGRISALMVVFNIMEGVRPPRPTHPKFTNGLWILMQRCWNRDPSLRPEVSLILDTLRGINSSRTYFLPVLLRRFITPRVGSDLLENATGDHLSISPGAADPSGCVSSTNPPPLKLGEIKAEWQGPLAQEFIDELDIMLDQATSDQERHELLNILCKMCSRQRMLPKVMHVGHLTGELVEADSGGHAVIFRAQRNNRSVAVKTIRITMNSDFDKCHSEFCREAAAWRHLRHPNILPLLGVDLEKHQLSMVSEWMDEGNINEYVKTHGGVNRLQLLVDAATGLEYMHGLNVVHGDLKGANILINRRHRACLADFGLSTIVRVEHNIGSTVSIVSRASLMSFTAGGTPRWMSPELLDPERFGASDDRPTKKSDCYALGMVVYEVLSGRSPFWEITNQISLIYAITEGERPGKPDAAESLGFIDELWKTVQQCWLTDFSARPDVRTILSHLNHATWSWERRRLV